MAKVMLRNVVKRFSTRNVVDNVSLEIADREFLVLVGPSGCGKSTTLRMVAGLDDITSGEVYIGDRLVNDVPPKDRDIAMVFQNYALYPHMNVYENMAFSLRLKKVAREEIDRRVTEAASILGLAEFLKRKPNQLSGGQRQRVALGRAIVREPQVFLMDEPLSNLDAKLRVQMRAELIKLHRRLQTTVIYVTHDQTEAMTMGDRIAVMKDGVVQQVADPYTIYHHPANKFVAGFIGSPPMSFLELQVEADGDVVRLTRPGISLRVPESKAAALRSHVGRTIVMGIRPENLHINPEAIEWLSHSTAPAVVEVVEPMGAETYLYVSVAGTVITARVSAEARVKAGDRLTLAMDLEKMHAFDPESEIALTA